MKINLNNTALSNVIKEFGCEEIHIQRDASGIVFAIAENLGRGTKMFRILEKQSETEAVHIVLGEELQRVLVKMTADIIKVEVKESTITVKGEAKVKSTKLEKEVPVMEYLKSKEGSLSAFKKDALLAKVSYLSAIAAVKDDIRPILTGICMTNKDGTVELSATDSFVAAVTEVEYNVPKLPERSDEDDEKWEKLTQVVETQKSKALTPFTTIVKAIDLEKAIRLLDGDTVYMAVVPNKEVVVFTATNMVSLKPLSGKSININSLITASSVENALVLTSKEVEKIVNIIPVLESAVEHSPMILDNTDEGLGIYSKSTNGLRVFSQLLEVEDKREMLSAFNPKFLKKTLSIPNVKLHITGKLKAAIFENGDIKGLVLPVNFDGFNRDDYKN